jgi:hypothetical protein
LSLTGAPEDRPEPAPVAEAAAAEPLPLSPPEPDPAEIAVTRVEATDGLVSVWTNQSSSPPGVIGTEVWVRWRVGTDRIDIASGAGTPVASHRLAPREANRTGRPPEHTKA